MLGVTAATPDAGVLVQWQEAVGLHEGVDSQAGKTWRGDIETQVIARVMRFSVIEALEGRDGTQF